MNLFENPYKGKEIFLVGALDAIGVPYTIDNIHHKSFVELTAEYLKKQGAQVIYCNLCNLGRNKTWELENILQMNYTIKQFISFNQNASEYIIKHLNDGKGWPFPTNLHFLEEYYQIPEYSDIHITTMLKESAAPIFIYSCGWMNFQKYFKMESGIISKNIIYEILLHSSEYMQKIEDDIEHCLKQILSLNPNIQIYVVGTYAMLESTTFRNFASPLVNLYNNRLHKIVNKYDNMHYVDITKVKDYVVLQNIHPTYEGQKYIAKQMIKTMNSSIR